MRIVIDARFLSVPMTGIASYTEGLMSGFTETDNLSADEYLFFVPQQSDVQRHGVRFKTCNVPVVTLQQHLLMPFYLSRAKPDIYHYPHFDLPFCFKMKSVITIHGLKYVKVPDLFRHRSNIKSFSMKTVMIDSIRRASRVITVSKDTKNDIVNILKVSPDKITVIYEAADSCYTTISKSDSVRLPYLLLVGDISPHKNLGRLLKAFTQVKYKEYHLVIAGRSYPDYSEPFKLVKRLKLAERTKFLGSTSKQELVYLYNAATAFILPSLYEGFGIPVLEAMACGTPVITSNTSSLPEVAGDAALLVDPYDVECMTDAINQVLGSSTLQQKLREKGLKRAKEFSWLKTARETTKVYREAYNEKKN